MALEGDLGAGKSELARAVIHALAGAAIEVPSPTFTLVQDYAVGGLRLTHADLYRLSDPAEVDELGLDDALRAGVLLIEWPERAGNRLPADRLTIRLAAPRDDPDARDVELEAAGPCWTDRLESLRG